MTRVKYETERQYEKNRRRTERRRPTRKSQSDEARWRLVEKAKTNTWPESQLNEDHWEVVKQHGVTAEVASAAGLRSLETGEHRRSLADPVSKYSPLPALGLPVADFGHPVVSHWVLRPDKPRMSDGDPVKYDHPPDVRIGLYVLPSDRERIVASTEPLWITEGIFDALALESSGHAAIGLTGIYGWRSEGGPHPWWQQVHLDGRRVNIVFDADQRYKPQVRRAAIALEEHLRWSGADPANIEVVGADDIADYVAKGGNPNDLRPYGPADPDVYDLSQEVIEARYIETRRQLGLALVEDMRRHGLTKSCVTMQRLAEAADVCEHSAQLFGEAIGAEELHPFVHDGWHRWSRQLKSRVIALDLAYLAEWKQDRSRLIRPCLECRSSLPPGRKSRKYCADRCKMRSHRRRQSHEASCVALR
jgi:hypothetical protein